MSAEIPKELIGESVSLPATRLQEESVHIFSNDEVHAINGALAARRPLLVRGEPGSGKTQLARAAAEVLKWPFTSKTVDARTESHDLLWSFDSVGRLAQAQILGPGCSDQQRVEKLADARFVRPEPLWWALNWESAATISPDSKPSEPDSWKPRDGCVVLIDEIDKADSSVPNGLLEALGSGFFEPPGFPQGVAYVGGQFPLVMVATNAERALPDAFLRRCLVLSLKLPKAEELKKWLVTRGRAHYKDQAVVSDDILELAAGLFPPERQRAKDLDLAAPGQAEYLDLIRVVVSRTEGVPNAKKRESRQKRIIEQTAEFVLSKHPADDD